MTDVTGVSSTGATTSAPAEVVALLHAALDQYDGELDAESLAVATLAAFEQCGYVITRPEQVRPSDPNFYQPTPIRDSSGMRMRVHSAAACDPSIGCPIHNPSMHALDTAPIVWRHDRFPPVFERTCKHGIGHPDPDSLEWIGISLGAEQSAIASVHGCDGCCLGPVSA